MTVQVGAGAYRLRHSPGVHEQVYIIDIIFGAWIQASYLGSKGDVWFWRQALIDMIKRW
jgi:hypothetical protein